MPAIPINRSHQQIMTPSFDESGYPDEHTLITGLQQGRESAFRCLVNTYQMRLVHLAYGITLDREESMDIVQEVFVNVHRHIHGFRGKAGLMSWLRKMTVNQCLNWKRRWKRRFRNRHQPLASDTQDRRREETETIADTPESDLVYRQTAERIQAAVSSLPERLRTVFILKTVDHLSYDEIARVLEIRPGTVSSRLYQARKRLADQLEKSI